MNSQTEADLLVAFNAASIGHWIWDVTTNSVVFSDAWQTLRGVRGKPPESIAVSLRKAHPDDRDRLESIREQLIRGQIESSSLDYRVEKSDGSWIWVEERATAIKDNEGKVVRLVGCEIDITKRKQDELKRASESKRALRDSQRKFANLASAAPVAIFRMSEDPTDCVYVNDRWGELTQQPIGEAMGRGWMRFVHPDHFNRIQKQLADFTADPTRLVTEPYEVQRVLPDGSTCWVQCTMAKELNDHGTVTGYVGTISDIDAVKQAEEKVKELNHRLQKVLEASSIGIWEWQFAEERLVWDERMCEIHGVDPSDFKGTFADWQDRVHPDDLDRTNIDPENGQTALEFRIVRPNGEIRHVYSRFKLETNDDGTWKRVTGVNVDITGRREAELALQDAQRQITRITDNVPGMVYRHVFPTGSGLGTFVSAKCEQMFGVDHAAATEDITLMFKWIHPDDLPLLRELCRESIAEQKPMSFEYRVNHPEKGTRWYQTHGHPCPLEQGKVALDGFVLDITAQKNAELELQRANEELAHATKMKDEFLATMSHELRTPLGAILGMTEGLCDGISGPLNHEQLDGLDVIRQSGSHLLDLINEVLDLSKIESGSLELQLAPVHAASFCEACLQLITKQAEKKNIELKLNLPANLPKFEADEKRLRQIIVNLLSNAVKFTPHGGRVSLEVEQPDLGDGGGKHLRISVSDNGIGIASSDLEKLFEPFVQVDSSLSREYDGTGLGLSLVKRFVELHSGSVSVRSKLGKGSCFSVDLPLRPSVSTDPQSDHRIDPRQITNWPKQPDSRPSPLVLLAEDNELVAKTTIRFLDAFDYRVQLATDGNLAIDAARCQSPDVILMDVQMPEVDGLEAIRQIRQMPQHEETPIIALTGLAMQNDASRCLAAGANNYLSKPYGMKQLVELIEKVLYERATDQVSEPGQT